jgi:hypothetical protein
VDKEITLELMRRERGSTVAIRATSLPESQVSTINAQVGLPRVGEGAAGLLCPMDAVISLKTLPVSNFSMSCRIYSKCGLVLCYMLERCGDDAV